jgi:hypothetical protein
MTVPIALKYILLNRLGHQKMARRLAGTIIIDGTDDEFWPQRDEHTHRVFNVETILNTDQPASTIDVPDVRWGGECRVELKLLARLLDTNAVQIEGNARLFEGTDENTDDLEDEQDFTFIVPTAGTPAFYRLQLKNTEVFGGDHAEIGLSLTNSRLEE